MFFPIGDEQVERGHKPIFSYLFLAVNILVFIFEISLDAESLNAFTFSFGAIPSEFLHGHQLYSLVTSLFLHGGWGH
ncbi:MAG TPA: rhomboid family intramembrane serine protease, partial [Saprospiraceae bacterium]|nr:rhomboid family intramembrane serine protease [Saprospiraceae bacterium]